MDERFAEGPDPLQQPRIGTDLVPYYMVFYPGDESKFWMLDTIHSPEPLYPLEYETSYIALSEYADSFGSEVNKVPTSHGNAFRILNGWCYFSPIDITDPEEIEARAPIIAGICADVYPRWEEWLDETEVPHRAAAEWLASFDFEKDPDLGDTRQTYSLVERFDAVLAALYNSGGLHIETMVLVFGQKLAFTSLCQSLVPSVTDEEINTMLQGFGNKLMKTDDAFWRLGELAHQMGIVDLLDDEDGSALEKLSQSPDGKRWLEELRKVVSEYGVRHVGGCYNLMSPSWIEDLNYPISFVRGFLHKIQQGEKLVPAEFLTERREKAVSQFRTKIKTEEDKKKFDENLHLLQRMYPWYEDHNFLYEGLIGTRVHLKMIELGRRLVNEGYIDDPYDIGYFLLSELRQLLYALMCKRLENRSTTLVDFRPMIAERKRIRQEQAKWKPPVVLGLKPLVAPENPVAVFVYGALPEIIERGFKEFSGGEEVLEIEGLPGSPGVAEGPARLVFAPGDLKDVRPGEILVCGSTNPMWNPVFAKVKGVVTDTGGLLAHAAVICREYGLPAVVGTATGTKVIKMGDRLRVDGGQGVVTIIRD